MDTQKKHFMILHERMALAKFDSQDKAKKFIKKLSKQKEWLNNKGFYYIVEVKEHIRVL